MKTAIATCLAWLMVLSSTSVGAIVANDGFDDAPAFSGWEQLGLTSIETSAFGINPTSPNNQALLRTGDGGFENTGATVANLENFLSASITGIAPSAVNGSAIRQTITNVSVGDKLTFSWNFLTSESLGATRQDTAFFSVSHVEEGTSQTFFLADPSDANTGFISTEFSTQSLYSDYAPLYEFATDGTYVLGFGVVNRDSVTGPSGLLIDSVRLTAVPEPTSLAGLGLVGLALTFRRRRK